LRRRTAVPSARHGSRRIARVVSARRPSRHYRTRGSTMTTHYSTAETRHVQAADGIDYAYRQVGEGEPVLVLLQHFRGNLDNWDPALIDALAAHRRVITFDNAGVGGSSGQTPPTVEAMAFHAIAFIDALELE